MINKSLLATAVVGGALLAAGAPASAGEHSRAGGIRVADNFCAAPWLWNGPAALLHEGHAPGYATCTDVRTAGDDAVSVLDDACAAPWRWNGPLEIFTIDHSSACSTG
ncbi:hypothetical protein AB0A63_25490 [Lentzea sp. NPDC042327]|uniref:hypothetical protein n=1 Tax=Lentzea sp. NPDC042327 TaxID=3154801 RepID=UPI0033DF27A2